MSTQPSAISLSEEEWKSELAACSPYSRSFFFLTMVCGTKFFPSFLNYIRCNGAIFNFIDSQNKSIKVTARRCAHKATSGDYCEYHSVPKYAIPIKTLVGCLADRKILKTISGEGLNIEQRVELTMTLIAQEIAKSRKADNRRTVTLEDLADVVTEEVHRDKIVKHNDE